MAHSHIPPEGKIRIKQQKTERELLIPLHRDTVAALDAYKMQHIVIINTEYGKPFTVDGFSGGCATQFRKLACLSIASHTDCARRLVACSPKLTQPRR
jgi:hypothetical protein